MFIVSFTEEKRGEEKWKRKKQSLLVQVD
jgi:hypothetical protein